MFTVTRESGILYPSTEASCPALLQWPNDRVRVQKLETHLLQPVADNPILVQSLAESSLHWPPRNSQATR
jgi:hypothetical protein